MLFLFYFGSASSRVRWSFERVAEERGRRGEISLAKAKGIDGAGGVCSTELLFEEGHRKKVTKRKVDGLLRQRKAGRSGLKPSFAAFAPSRLLYQLVQDLCGGGIEIGVFILLIC